MPREKEDVYIRPPIATPLALLHLPLALYILRLQLTLDGWHGMCSVSFTKFSMFYSDLVEVVVV